MTAFRINSPATTGYGSVSIATIFHGNSGECTPECTYDVFTGFYQYFIFILIFYINKATNGRRGATPRWAISGYEANKEGSVSHTIRISEVWLTKD